MASKKLLLDKELPKWYKSERYIKSGYRPPGTVWSAFKSIGEWHNQTLNIHSHLWPGVYWLYLFYRSTSNYNWIISNGFLCGALMTLFSAYYHTVLCVSPKYEYISHRLHYIGIVLVNFSHQQLDTYIISYMILNNPCFFYVATAIELSLVIGSILHISTITWAGKFWATTYPIISSIPLTAYVVANSSQSKNIEIVASYSVGCSMLVILSASIFYIGRFPERCWDGKYDHCSSHFWFHLLIVASVSCAYGAIPHIQKSASIENAMSSRFFPTDPLA
jgi:adiponectin receptor